MTRTFCDCCGKEISGRTREVIVGPDDKVMVVNDEFIYQGRWDLCGGCHLEVIRFIGMKALEHKIQSRKGGAE